MQGTRQTIHIFNPFRDFHGGSERSALSIAAELRRHQDAPVQLWHMNSRIDRRFVEAGGVRRAHPLNMPRCGIFIFVGAYWTPKSWIALARPQRLCVVVNTNDVDQFQRHRPLYEKLCPDLRYYFRSRLQRDLHQAQGEIQASPIELGRFGPRAAPPPPSGPLRVGRVSRDVVEKHHYLYDPELYRQLAREDFSFRIMGGTCLSGVLAPQPNIELLPAGAAEVPDFYGGLDACFYRTGTFYETFCRTIFEAMACGLPPVCERFGGYTEYLRDGEDALLFEGQQQALQCLRALRDPELRQRLGNAARATAERLFSPEAEQRRVAQMVG